jgi:hypothetical protein
MVADDGGKVFDEVTLGELKIGRVIRHRLDRSHPAGQRRKEPIVIPGVALHDQGADSIAVPPISLSVRDERRCAPGLGWLVARRMKPAVDDADDRSVIKRSKRRRRLCAVSGC